jgi:hypothetical protein
MKRRRESTDHVMGTVNLLLEFSGDSKIGDRPSGRMPDVLLLNMIALPLCKHVRAVVSTEGLVLGLVC